MGLRSDEGPDRKKHPAFLTVQANRARIVDEWLPIKDWAGTSRCSCLLCVFASKRDILLSIGRRPRLAAFYAEVEQVRGDSFRADWRITDLIRHAAQCEAPEPGAVCLDDGPEFTTLQDQVRAALEKGPRKEPDLARRRGRAMCEGCTVHS